MKIEIYQTGQPVSMRIPSWLIYNPLTARIVCAVLEKKTPEAVDSLSPRAVKIILQELKRIREQQGSWVLVEVDTAEGKRVTVSL